ncbi:MAG: hypothetical protein WB609_07355 [Candidatus Cybelea sp.]
MNGPRAATIALVLSLVPVAALARRGGFARPSGGFDFHGEPSGSHPQSYSHSSTGPSGTNRTTNVTNTGNGYNRTTTATNGGYNRTSTGGASSNGNYYHSSNGSSPYGSHSSSTSGNYSSGNYTHNGSGNNPYGSYSTSGSGNTHSHTYSGSTTATNQWGQTYHSSTYASDGYVYHGAVVTNPVYAHYPVWGWNGGYAWYAAPYYWGGGFWGAFAIGAASAAVYGSIVAANNATYTSYQTQPESPGAKLLSSYHLTQTQCGPPNLVVIYGPNNSVICAYPNNTVSAGNYSVDTQTLTIVSEKPSS